MAQRSIPALLRTCNRKMPLKAALLKRTRAQRIPFRPGARYSNKGRIHSRRPIPSSSLFACKTAADHTFRLGGQPPTTVLVCVSPLVIGVIGHSTNMMYNAGTGTTAEVGSQGVRPLSHAHPASRTCRRKCRQPSLTFSRCLVCILCEIAH